MWRENCMTIFKIFKRDFPKVLKNAHSCLLLSGTQKIESVFIWYRIVTDWRTDLLYQYRASVYWRAIKIIRFSWGDQKMKKLHWTDCEFDRTYFFSKTTTLLPSAKCTRPLFQGRTGCGGRPSGWHDIVTCQRLVLFNVATLFRSSKSMYRPNFIDISQFTAEI